ncbi:MAG: recombinase RecT [Acidobacteriota bacterium]
MDQEPAVQLQPAIMSTSSEEWQVLIEQANILLQSGFLPEDIKRPAQAVAIILQGRELGIGAMAALQNINIIKGKPTISPQLMLALINRSKQLENMEISDDGNKCTVLMKRYGRSPFTVSFSMEDAAKIKTFEKGAQISLCEKYNWRQMPSVMRRWRAIAAAARIVFPDVILGLYTPEEMGAEVDEDGNIVCLRADRKAQILAEEVALIEMLIPAAHVTKPHVLKMIASKYKVKSIDQLSAEVRKRLYRWLCNEANRCRELIAQINILRKESAILRGEPIPVLEKFPQLSRQQLEDLLIYEQQASLPYTAMESEEKEAAAYD